MGVSCKICNKNVSSRQSGMKCGKCSMTFHSACARINEDQLNQILSNAMVWYCEKCRSENLNSSVITTDDDVSGATLNYITKKDMQSLINTVKNEILSELNTKFTTLLDSVNFCSNKITDFEANLKRVNEKLKLIDTYKEENDNLKIKINDLNKKICDMEDYSRRNNVEIQGVPEVRGENVVEIVDKIGKNIGVNCELSQIDACHRVPSRNKERPKSIIVKFNSRLVKQNFVAAARVKRGSVTTSKLGYTSAPDTPIYVTDHLTPMKKDLLFKTKKFCRDNDFKYVWVNDSKILIRKADNSRIIVIHNEEFLNTL